MKKTLFILLFSFVCFITFAQQKNPVSLETYNKVYDEVEKLKDKLADLEAKHKHTLDSLNKLVDSRKNDLAISKKVRNLEDANRNLKNILNEKNSELQQISNTFTHNISNNESLVRDVEDRNTLLVKAFQGAIYYPIRSRFSNSLVNEALRYGPIFSEDAGLKKSFEQYKEMLSNYKFYNENLISCLQDCIAIAKNFKKGNYKEGTVKNYAAKNANDKIMAKIKSSAYYNVYVKMLSNPNAASIPYLDGIMKDLLGRMEDLSKRKDRIIVDEKIYELFIKKLTPKD